MEGRTPAIRVDLMHVCHRRKCNGVGSKKNNEFFQQYKNGTICPKEFALFSYEFLAMNDYDLLLQIRKNFFDNKINLNNQYRSQLGEVSAEELTKETTEPVGIADLRAEDSTIKNLSAQAVAVIMKIDKLGTSCPTCLQEIRQEKVTELKIEIEKTDKEIDGIVYELYKLTENEIKIVENANA